MLGRAPSTGSIVKLKVLLRVVGLSHFSFASYLPLEFLLVCYMIWNLIIGSRDSPTENGLETTTKRARSKKQAENDIDFTKNLEKEVTDLFVPPRNPKSLLLPKNRAPCNTKLPEDCHYQPEDLVKLFLLPNVKVNVATSLPSHYLFIRELPGFNSSSNSYGLIILAAVP